MSNPAELRKTLGPVMLWALGVGYVISGMYFGWNLGLPLGGPFGMLAATVIVSILYITFVLSYAELSCAIPKAGGAYVYATRAFGARAGFLGGTAQWVEFVFAPPAIAKAIGDYFAIFFPNIPSTLIAVVFFVIFTALNIYGVKQSAAFELIITVIAVVELLIFAGLTLPHFSWSNFSRNPLPGGWMGIFPALPFAIWFYLAIEGVANVAEETVNPQRNIVLGFTTAIGTLIILAFLTLFAAVGVNGWESVVFTTPDANQTSDKPLPLALAKVVGQTHPFYHMLVVIGLGGLLASFHGIILCAGRATFEFGRTGYAPRIFGRVLQHRQTPAAALLLNMAIGIIALLTGKTDTIILISVFGALTLYVVAMLAFFKLRRTEPEMPRPYRTPLYPWSPAIALILSLICLGTMVWFNRQCALVYAAILIAGYAWFFFCPKQNVAVA